TNGDWFSAADWSPVGVPKNAGNNIYAAIINAGNVSLNSTVTTSSFTLGSAAQLTVGTGSTYSVGLQSVGTSSIDGTAALLAGSSLDARTSLTLTNTTITGPGAYRQLLGQLIISGTASIDNLVVNGAFIIGGSGSLTVNNRLD